MARSPALEGGLRLKADPGEVENLMTNGKGGLTLGKEEPLDKPVPVPYFSSISELSDKSD